MLYYMLLLVFIFIEIVNIDVNNIGEITHFKFSDMSRISLSFSHNAAARRYGGGASARRRQRCAPQLLVIVSRGAMPISSLQ